VAEKVNKLFALANNNDNEEEADTAMEQAKNLIAEHNLMVVPKELGDIEHVRKVVAGAIKKVKDEGKNNLLIGLAAGALLGGKMKF